VDGLFTDYPDRAAARHAVPAAAGAPPPPDSQPRVGTEIQEIPDAAAP
jgi:hypothetical protein